jgi:hypothetical protein
MNIKKVANETGMIKYGKLVIANGSCLCDASGHHESLHGLERDDNRMRSI